MGRATYFCVDIECSGPVPALYDMISLGCVTVARQGDGTFALGESLYLEIRPTAPKVDPGAMKVNGLDIERLRREGLELTEALTRLGAFVAAHTAEGTTPVFVGHNAPFDWSFVSWCYEAVGMKNPFGYKALDTKAMSIGILGLHWFDTNKEELEALLGLPAQDQALAHRADYDAWFQAQILIGLLARAPEAVRA
jgi:DNA polymerase III alpha subunit (gram-positive type)